MTTLLLGLWLFGHSWTALYVRMMAPHEQPRMYQYCVKHDTLHRVQKLHPVKLEIYPDEFQQPVPQPAGNDYGRSGFTLR